jgi:hypothetical protein
MKLFLYLTGCLLLTIAGRAQNITAGLVCHYKFSNNALDAGINQHHLINTGAVLTSDRFGNPNSAYYFEGNSHMSVDSVSDMEFSNLMITTSGWLKIAGVSGGPGDWRVVAVGKENTHWQSCTQAVSRYTNTALWVGSDGNNTYNYICTSNKTITPGTWYQVTCVADVNKDTSSIYINGKHEVSFYAPMSTLYLNNILETIMIGASIGASGDNFTGSLDEIRIYNRALTSAEILMLYNQDMINPNTGISEADNNKELIIYPNPASDKIKILSSLDLQQIDVINSAGVVVKSVKEGTAEDIITNDLAEGIYFLRIITREAVIRNEKIVVIK